MKLLMKKHRMDGKAAHLVDGNGTKLCNIPIKLSDWKLVDISPDGIVICYHCRRTQQKTIGHAIEANELSSITTQGW
jgi:hypothetical protein